jgi:hypothetical protein
MNTAARYDLRFDPTAITLRNDSKIAYNEVRGCLIRARICFEAAERFPETAEFELAMAITHLVSGLYARARARQLRDGALGLSFEARSPWA